MPQQGFLRGGHKKDPGCIGGLGDGIGLNYITVDEGLDRLLSEY